MILKARDFSIGSKTGGIQEAIDSIPSGQLRTSYGAIILIEDPKIDIFETIIIGDGTPGGAKDGLIIKGCGSGFITSAMYGLGGTTLNYKGLEDKPVIQINGGFHGCKFEDFAINGNNIASHGIRLLGDNQTSAITSMVQLNQIYIRHIKEICLDLDGIGSQSHDQVDLITVNNCEFQSSKICVRINSSQSILNRFIGSTFNLYTEYGFLINYGQAIIRDSMLSSNIGEAVYIGEGSANITVDNCHFELHGSKGIVSETGNTVTGTKNITANFFLCTKNDIDVLDLNHRGTSILIGNTIRPQNIDHYNLKFGSTAIEGHNSFKLANTFIGTYHQYINDNAKVIDILGAPGQPLVKE